MSGKMKGNRGFSFDFINTHQSDSRVAFLSRFTAAAEMCYNQNHLNNTVVLRGCSSFVSPFLKLYKHCYLVYFAHFLCQYIFPSRVQSEAVLAVRLRQFAREIQTIKPLQLC